MDLADPVRVGNRHRARILSLAAISAAALTSWAAVAAAGEIVLRPRYQVGDRYALALSAETETEVEARGAARNAFKEDVELRYAAQVEVLEIDGAGAPRRERHEGVDMIAVRPEGKRSLFSKGATYELTRLADGGVEIQFEGNTVFSDGSLQIGRAHV